ncbi:MAG: WbqC family protein [Flavobacteriales bacterium]|nr:WbqC family protein [Flavobacteriales bacterium]
MTLAVMQPYIFPYLGYFQLINAVDTFVFFNDVNYIKKGWINRNQILQNDTAIFFTVPLIKASQNKLINETYIFDIENWRTSFLKKVEFCYRKSPNYNEVSTLIREIISNKTYKSISELASDSVIKIGNYLGIDTEFVKSSDLDYDKNGTNGQHKIISIAQLLSVNQYINPLNGLHLYKKEVFDKQNISLKFIEMEDIKYQQNETNKFAPSLSIIDVLMFNSKKEVELLLQKYILS